MGTKYSTLAVSGFNATPPADDGSTAASNQVKWSTIKTKLADPLNTFAAAINSQLVTALDQSVRLVTASDNTVAGDHDKTIVIGSTVTAAITITLADAATMAAGYVVTINNQSGATCTIGRATASNTINGATSDYSLPSLASITFIVASPATGYIAKDFSPKFDSAGNVYGPTFVLKGYTFATLPSPPTQGMTAFITDSSVTTFLNNAAGGGASVVPVFYNGTNWVVG